MRIFLTRWTARFVRRERVSGASLAEAVERAERGLVDADLGGGLIKMRVARSGQGRSGGFRTMLAFKSGDRAVFLYAFAKNERENVGPDELQTLRELARAWLRAGDADLEAAARTGQLEEMDDGKRT
ncbi:type II toxin-antitoxin system RelE/ParE family toxin [Rhizobium sp. C1]|uniref:type II toxin-antitoxin system RelE/ParE family toxin n=1 Tax=Rhizobium sp. C1 TaxID=1349799 RepID=UPI001E54FCFD|nr:type II toxin-antitoxin system RelE/ParE family toxin [Rhizobium sp. C1]MCD2177482.1 type II toxin-antitoxin system RelE/ParE family toxin [Rhizobium sp. C1]